MADPSNSKPSEADRRDSPRVPMKLLIRDLAEGGSFQELEGDISVGGVAFHVRYPPTGSQFEVRFRLPGQDKDVRCKAELIRIRDEAEGKGVHLRFLEIDVDQELAIARYIDDLLEKDARLG